MLLSREQMEVEALPTYLPRFLTLYRRKARGTMVVWTAPPLRPALPFSVRCMAPDPITIRVYTFKYLVAHL